MGSICETPSKPVRKICSAQIVSGAVLIDNAAAPPGCALADFDTSFTPLFNGSVVETILLPLAAPMMIGVRRGRGVLVGGYVGEAASAVIVKITATLVARVLGVFFGPNTSVRSIVGVGSGVAEGGNFAVGCDGRTTCVCAVATTLGCGAPPMVAVGSTMGVCVAVAAPGNCGGAVCAGGCVLVAGGVTDGVCAGDCSGSMAFTVPHATSATTLSHETTTMRHDRMLISLQFNRCEKQKRRDEFAPLYLETVITSSLRPRLLLSCPSRSLRLRRVRLLRLLRPSLRQSASNERRLLPSLLVV